MVNDPRFSKRELIKQEKARLEKSTNGNLITRKKVLNEIFGNAENQRPINEIFVGRGKELLRLKTILNNNDISFVLGHRGSGKTALCHLYTQQFGHLYKDIIYLNATNLYNSGNTESINSYFAAEIAKKEHINIKSHEGIQELTYSLRERLKSNKKYLIIIDDFNILPKHVTLDFYIRIKNITKYCKFVFSGSSFDSFSGSELLENFQNKVVALYGLTHNEIFDLVNKRIEHTKIKKEFVVSFLEKLFSTIDNIPEFTTITPRIILKLLYEFIQSNNFNFSLNSAINDSYGKLSNLIITEINDELKVLPALQFGPKQIITPNSTYFTSSQYIVVPTIRHFWHTQLEEFEFLLKSPSTKEKDFQYFFESNPHFLQGLDYKHVHPHPVLERDEDGDLIPDFFLQPLNSSLVDILDLKLHTAGLVVGSKNRLRFSSEVNSAIAQLREYRDYFQNKKYREKIEEKYGITAYNPKTIVVIGRTPKNISEVKLKQIFEDKPKHIEIITFDDLHAKMRQMAEMKLFN